MKNIPEEDKLSDRLQYYADEYWFIHEDIVYDAKKLEAQIPQWISVKDKLPKYEVEVLVCRKDNTYWWGMVIEKPDNSFYVRYGNKWVFAKDVTHWMPLPKPPEDK